jgi:hypothetical protein
MLNALFLLVIITIKNYFLFDYLHNRQIFAKILFIAIEFLLFFDLKLTSGQLALHANHLTFAFLCALNSLIHREIA